MAYDMDYYEIDFGPRRNNVDHAGPLYQAGELITQFLNARGVPAIAQPLCRKASEANPLLLIVTPQTPPPVAIDVLQKSDARHPNYPDMDFASVAISVRDKGTGAEGILLWGGQPTILMIASTLDCRLS